QQRAKCKTKALAPEAVAAVRKMGHLPRRGRAAGRVEEGLGHPPPPGVATRNPGANNLPPVGAPPTSPEGHRRRLHDVEIGPLGTPVAVWPLASQDVRCVRKPGSKKLVDWYEYGAGPAPDRFDPKEVIHFRYPNPRDPYSAGLAPLRAVYEQQTLMSEYS